MDTLETMTRGQRFVRDSRVAVLFVLIASLFWGSAFPAIKRSYVLLGVLPGDVQVPIAYAGVRFLVAGLVLVAIGSVGGIGVRLSRKRMKFIFILGIVQTFFQYAAFYIGMSLTTGVKAAVIVASGSFFLALFSPFIYKDDRLQGKKIVALLIGFAGVILANLTRTEDPGQENQWIGDVMILITALCSAGASLLSKRLVQSVPPVFLNGLQLTIGAVFLLAVAMLPGLFSMPEVSLELVFLTFYLALITSVAFSLYYVVVKYHSLTRVAAYRFLIPLCGVTESALLIPGETLDARLFVAAGLVILGIFIVNRPSTTGK